MHHLGAGFEAPEAQARPKVSLSLPAGCQSRDPDVEFLTPSPAPCQAVPTTFLVMARMD